MIESWVVDNAFDSDPVIKMEISVRRNRDVLSGCVKSKSPLVYIGMITPQRMRHYVGTALLIMNT